MGFKVGQARKKFNIKYPHLYADKDNCPNEKNRNEFNCVQRGHQNSLENQPIFLALLICAGLKYPVASASLGAVYLAGKIAYFNGYSTGIPNKRLIGSIAYLGLLPLIGICAKIAYEAFSR
eukprot:CAMPEP_0175078842 /NCGR_PEP_ID=MMETSP0052_2-20121109/24415_1 /TAXON_ID=51329 ORGANISM="Polytomella parva, Strain SAG 63-3" /NCGR_SAMPLE_ID=MMETSP0052_2 /ASSEMBLY_ACC=CAM_ASM_000194 /LENGTH=120 /DNA_ID=CAMNT_0016348953 /DNA_START=150 /DNA_END=512 /DNA_ORIENTATION=+